LHRVGLKGAHLLNILSEAFKAQAGTIILLQSAQNCQQFCVALKQRQRLLDGGGDRPVGEILAIVLTASDTRVALRALIGVELPQVRVAHSGLLPEVHLQPVARLTLGES
jgi:hypothetical protein